MSFHQENHQGDIICFGVGGGNLPAAAVDNMYSIATYGGVVASAYTALYGDDMQAELDIRSLI